LPKPKLCRLSAEFCLMDSELEGDGWLQAIHPDDHERTRQAWAYATQIKSLFEIEYRLRRADGIYRYFLARGIPILDRDGTIQEWIGTCADIDDRKQTELALQKALQETESQSRLLRTVLDSTQDWIFAKDRDFCYILVNRSFAEAIGQTPETMLGKNDLEVGFSEAMVLGCPDQQTRGFRADDQVALTGKPVHNPYDLATIADGSVRIFDTRKTPLYNSSGTVFGMLGFSRDWTNRHHAEESLRRSEAQLKEKADELEQTLQALRHTQTQMIQAEKMSGLGQLVAGIAHEINNPVSFIHGNLSPVWDYTQHLLTLLELYQTQFPTPNTKIQALIADIDLEFVKEDLPKVLASMKTGTERIREIVLSLRNFSRLDEADMKAVDLHQGIDSTLVILGNRLRAKQPEIEIMKHYGNLPLVECYAGQLNQVFMNVLNNAIDALEEKRPSGAPRFAIDAVEASRLDHPSTGNQRPEVHHPCIHISTQLIDADYVEIRVADNGLGMTEAVCQRVFDPFFTTKPIGKGTGMGLSISYQIITEKHSGSLSCQSELGQGTKFIIQIPLRQQSMNDVVI
ncbi:MAG: PAS domain-containing sensor histidine kinase, partial [Leptolyngbya sp.]